MKALPLQFYRRNTESVARELIGKKLVHLKNSEITSGLIIETEAYLGIKDPACHTYGGRKTERVKSMYLNGGFSYVYFIYGMHYCFNVVTQTPEQPEAVLIRALYPLDGIEIMRARRQTFLEKNLCSGPAKLCKAMSIDRSSDGLSLKGPELWIENSVPFEDIQKYIKRSSRIGIDYAGEAKNWPLRFSIDSKHMLNL